MPEEPAFVVLPTQTLQALLQEVQGLKDQIKALEERQNEDNTKLHREIALDRQRINKLEQSEPQPRNLDRGQVLKAIIVTNGGKLSRKEARKLMRLSESQFSQLLAASKDFIDISPSKLDHRIKILKLK